MNSIIICEGLTDCLFIQYYMRNVCHWSDKSQRKNKIFKWCRELMNDSNSLLLGHNGGSSRLCEAFESVMKSNYYAQDSEIYHNVVIMTDRDDDQSERNIINDLMFIMNQYKVININEIKSSEWCTLELSNNLGEIIKIKLLLLVVPLDTHGAIETVLLDSLSKNDEYDHHIVEKSKEFVRNVDYKNQYLEKRRHRVKAEFNVFFSIRVPEDYYTERQKIFMNFPWKDNQYIQQVFQKLNDLS